jgi:hypothetical protein
MAHNNAADSNGFRLLNLSRLIRLLIRREVARLTESGQMSISQSARLPARSVVKVSVNGINLREGLVAAGA